MDSPYESNMYRISHKHSLIHIYVYGDSECEAWEEFHKIATLKNKAGWDIELIQESYPISLQLQAD